MNEPINIPFGLCQITYNDVILSAMGSEGTFYAIPKYQVLSSGVMGSKKNYILEEYYVGFEVSLEHESYETLKLHMPTLQNHKNGLYDSPNKVNTKGKRLVIHPYSAGASKDFDLCIWDAYIDPESVFKRTFDKQSDKFNVRFIANCVDKHIDPNLIKSYFFMGDWSKVGVS
jgi:hypothetical protein